MTPPDMLSQTMLAIPILLLFELGVYAARVLVPVSREAAD